MEVTGVRSRRAQGGRVPFGHGLERQRTPDRATAQILIVFGSLVTAASCILLWSTLAFGRFDDVTRLGIPVWLLAGLGIGGGLWIVWRGIAMYRANQSPRR